MNLLESRKIKLLIDDCFQLASNKKPLPYDAGVDIIEGDGRGSLLTENLF
jgi:hypothetical protein